MGGQFLRADPGHSVHYFTWVNLEGACISLAIGAAVYLLVVRGLLMRREADGMVYLDRWPARLELENLVYRPLLSALTFVGALCAGGRLRRRLAGVAGRTDPLY